MDIFKNLKEKVFEANIRLKTEGLVVLTWGNVSAIDREHEVIAIKPSGIPYHLLKPEQIVIVDLKTSAPIVENGLAPSSDTPTHLELYRNFPEIGAIVHTHSIYATVWSQACMEIPPLGTTHADTFSTPIPCTRPMNKEEIMSDYELNTGKVIVERIKGTNPLHCPAVLVSHHGPFTWGITPENAVENAVILEQVAQMAILTRQLIPTISNIPGTLLLKHFQRKHGPHAYYGQSSSRK